MACRNFSRDLKAGVGQRARTEEDFVRRILLLKKAFQMLCEIGLCPMQRLEQADRRSERRIDDGPLAPEVEDPCHHHDAVDRGGDKPKDAQGEQEMKHRDTVHPILR